MNFCLRPSLAQNKFFPRPFGLTFEPLTRCIRGNFSASLQAMHSRDGKGKSFPLKKRRKVALTLANSPEVSYGKDCKICCLLLFCWQCSICFLRVAASCGTCHHQRDELKLKLLLSLRLLWLTLCSTCALNIVLSLAVTGPKRKRK